MGGMNGNLQDNIYICTQKKTMTTTEQQQYTESQFAEALSCCRKLFADKLHDYGPSWRLLRPSSLTDQMAIKARRIRTLETTGTAMVDEGIMPEFVGLVNYGIIGLIQLQKGYVDEMDIDAGQALDLYDRYACEALELMKKKNHDYDEAWRAMRISSYTDFILTKLHRIKEMEDSSDGTLVSEGVDANYMDIINYAVFGVIRLKENTN